MRPGAAGVTLPPAHAASQRGSHHHHRTGRANRRAGLSAVSAGDSDGGGPAGADWLAGRSVAERQTPAVADTGDGGLATKRRHRQPAPAQSPAPAGAGSNTADTKPSPMPAAPAGSAPQQTPAAPPPETHAGGDQTAGDQTGGDQAAAACAVRRRRCGASAGPQPVSIISSPGGASATMDGRADASCKTPCTLDATPGRHTLFVAMPGTRWNTAKWRWDTSPLEASGGLRCTLITGTLMLTSVPTGAAFW